MDVASNYVPQYDVESHSGQVVKTIYTTLEFPYDVAVEQLQGGWCRNGMNTLKAKMPIYVKKMMAKKDLITEYDSMIDLCVNKGVGSHFKNWKMDKLKPIVDHHSPGCIWTKGSSTSQNMSHMDNKVAISISIFTG